MSETDAKMCMPHAPLSRDFCVFMTLIIGIVFKLYSKAKIFYFENYIYVVI